MSSATFHESARGYWERHVRSYDLALHVLGGPWPRMLQLTAEAVQGSSDVLEVGAGTGALTAALARSVTRLVATDYAVAMVTRLRLHLAEIKVDNVTCEQADVYGLSYTPGQFDAVVAANVLHLLPDVPRALAALRRVLRPEGKLVVPTFCHGETPLSRSVSRVLAFTGFPLRHRFTVASLVACLDREGLAVTRHEKIEGVIPIGYVDGVFG